MARQPIDLSTAPGTGLGTDLRSGGAMINANFAELYSLQSETVNAAAYTGLTLEARIQAAITDAAGYYVVALQDGTFDSTALTWDNAGVTFDRATSVGGVAPNNLFGALP